MNIIQLQKGYVVVNRKWKHGDLIELQLPMDIRVIAGNPKVEATTGRIALMRGPLVYCLEQVDNKDYFMETDEVYLHSDMLKAEFRKDLLKGVTVIHGKATMSKSNRVVDITAVPYYAWCNREQGRMKVWLPYQKN